MTQVWRGEEESCASSSRKFTCSNRWQYRGISRYFLINRYIYIFVPEYEINKVSTSADAVYSVSSKDIYYLNKGNTMEILRLQRRKRVCASDPCMKLKWGYLLTHIYFEREEATKPLGSRKKSSQNVQMLWRHKHAIQGLNLMSLQQVLLLARMSF